MSARSVPTNSEPATPAARAAKSATAAHAARHANREVVEGVAGGSFDRGADAGYAPGSCGS